VLEDAMLARLFVTRATILTEDRCRRCSAAVWFTDGEWACSMCGRAIGVQPVTCAPEAGPPSAVLEFLESRCRRAPDALASVTALYATYQAWAAARSQPLLGRPAFALALETAGFERWRSRKARFWRGLRLLAAGEQQTPPLAGVRSA
jgi:hypothetical protein